MKKAEKGLLHDADAEKWFLGCVFQDPRIIAQFAAVLEPVDFFLEKHHLIWQAMLALHRNSNAINVVSVCAEIKNAGKFHSVFLDGNGYVFDVSESVPSAADANYHAELIIKHSMLRKLLSSSKKTEMEIFKPDADPDVIKADALECIDSIGIRSVRANDGHVADLAGEYLSHLKSRMEQGLPMGAGTGFCGLDGMTGGLRSGEVVILGGRPGMGKTSFALDIALHAAKTMPVKFFSLEMDKKQLVPRILSFFSRVSLKRTINAALSEAELLNQEAVMDELGKLNIYAEFEASMKISEIFAEVHSFVFKHKAKSLIVIDHLHYLRTDGKNYENRNIELGKITHALKELAKKLDIPILLLSQLNRALDRAATKDKKPRLSDLRDSGNIEQDADMVWFIHRDGYYDVNVPPSDTDIIVAKNRSGPTGEVKLHFDTNTTRFSDSEAMQ